MQKPESELPAAPKDKAKKYTGRTIPVSVPRRIMCDLLAIAKAIPTVPVQRQMNVARVAAARARLAPAPDRPGWCMIFTKAFAITAQRFPELRRAYISFPYAHFYEHPISTASVSVEREFEGENIVLWGQLRRPEQKPLRELQARLRSYKEEPIRSFGMFRRVLLVGRLPRFLRRLFWWMGLNYSGRSRAGYMGTFGVSVYSSIGADSLHPISPLTTVLNYGTIGTDGDVIVRFVYDHRVMDGATVGRALAYMEEVLNQEIVAELEQEAKPLAA